MADKPDDLEAVRKLTEVLSAFGTGDQERIIRWAREKLGLPSEVPDRAGSEKASTVDDTCRPQGSGETKDIKTFVTEKNPTSDNQFAATVAHYYRFVAPQAARKDFITADDLQQACRLTGRNRLAKPSQTLVNAHTNGLLDKGTNRGEYAISTVGENLVAVSLPGSTPGTIPRRRAEVSRKKGPARADRRAKLTRRK